MPDDPNMIWIEDAASEYKRSRSWLEQQYAAGLLTVAKIPGDRRTYLKRDELDRLLRPREMRRGGESGGADEDGQQSAG